MEPLLQPKESKHIVSPNWDIINILLFNSTLEEQEDILRYFHTLPSAQDIENLKVMESLVLYHHDLRKLRDNADNISRENPIILQKTISFFSSRKNHYISFYHR